MEKAYTPNLYIDSISSMERGMNGGIAPELLAKNQFGVGVNTSIRGGFISVRPAFQKISINYPTPEIQSVVETGLFQGACYYKPDFGMESLLAQISGRLFNFKTSADGVTWDVLDVSVPGDYNSATIQQVWMWQSEKWMIIQDGTGVLPIFFDGTSSRRSLGGSKTVATTSESFVVPAIGLGVSVHVSKKYTGADNFPVIIDGEYWEISSDSAIDPITSLYKINIQPFYNYSYGSQPAQPSIPVDGYAMYALGSTGEYIGNIPPEWCVDIFNDPGMLGPFTGRYGPVYESRLTKPYLNQSIYSTILGFSGVSYIITNIDAPPAPEVFTVVLKNISDASTGKTINAGVSIISVPELPAGRMGAYGMSRNWMCLTDSTSYIAGDIVGGGSGSIAYNYRDSVLRQTENTFLTGGGSFRIPGTGETINAMLFPPILDSSLGQGQLQIFTGRSVFSNNSPVDRTTWTSVTSPIQTEALKDKGALGQNSTVLVNSDTFFRSDDGLSSLVLARRDFGTWGNKPISNEVQRFLAKDNKTLLQYGSAVTFDNRFLTTTSPSIYSGRVLHTGLVSLNFDLMSSLQTNVPPSWEGAWTGVNVSQILFGRIGNSKRTFAFTFDKLTSKNELYEILPEGTSVYADNSTTPIAWFFETPCFFGNDIKPKTDLCQLRDGEFYLSDIKGSVTVKIYYRPDYYPCWTLWRETSVCSDMSKVLSNPSYHMRVGLGEPTQEDADSANGRPMRMGNFFQFRVEITGACVFRGMKASAISVPQNNFAPIIESGAPCELISCSTTPDLEVYSLQNTPPVTPVEPVPQPCNFLNDTITQQVCPDENLVFTGNLPSWITHDTINFYGTAGTFCGISPIDANNKASTSLNQFVQAGVFDGTIKCQTQVVPNEEIIVHTDHCPRCYGIYANDGFVIPPQFNNSGNDVYVRAGSYFGSTQEEANASASAALDAFIIDLFANSICIFICGS